MALVQRLIDLTFRKGPGQPPFAESGTNTVKVSGLRVSAKVVKAGGNAMGTAQVRVYGLTLSIMNQLATLGMRFILQGRNTVTITAFDADTVPAIVFVGTITGAYVEFSGAPDVPFLVTAHTGIAEAVVPADPTSVRGPADVATMMSSLAATMGLKFENSGINAKLPTSYYSGSAMTQMRAIADAAGINAVVDDLTLAIWPKGGSRGSAVPVVSAQTGMIGYPTYTEYGLMVRTLFNPAIGFGGKVKVESVLEPANGIWAIYLLHHDLESQVPRGKWQTELGCYDPSFQDHPPVL